MVSERQYQTRQPGQSSQWRQAGFTLVELMVVVAVVGVLAIAAAPAMTAMVNNGRITGSSEELVTSLQLARSEAVRRNSRVTICAGSNGVCSGSASWAQWTVYGRDNTAAIPVVDVIRDSTVSGDVQFAGPTAEIVFRPSGLIDNSQQVEASMNDLRRCVTISISGAVSLSKIAC